MTNFPVSLDQFNNPTSSTKTNAPGFDHAEQHTNANDAIEALQRKIGIDESPDEDSIDFKIRRLLSRRLVNEVIGFGDEIETEFELNFTPIGNSLILVDGVVQPAAYVYETETGSFVVRFGSAPVGQISIIAITETEQNA